MRSKAHWAGWFLATLPALGVAAPADEPAVAGDLKTMQGTWTTDSFAGNPTTFTFRGRKLEVTAEGANVEYTISVTLDEKARPEKTIDLKTEESTTAGAIGKTSPGIYRFEGDDRLILCFRAHGDRPKAYETQGFEQWNLELKRVAARAGTKEKAAPAAKAVEPKAANADAPLPDGWPDATKPGRIEVKTYPRYRSAIVREKGATAPTSDGRMFFSLFAHITGKGVEMTAPVVMTYEPRVIERVGEKGEMSMEFLYQHPDQGQVGPGVGRVRVEDHPAVTVVSLGVQGRMDPARMREGVTRLRAWLDQHKAEWVAAGPPRRLGYHGPMTPEARQLNDVQIPIKPAR